MIFSQNAFRQKFLPSLLIIFILGSFVGSGLLYPQKAQALFGVGDIVNDPILTALNYVWKVITTIWQYTMKAATWINTKLAIWDKLETLNKWAEGMHLNWLLHFILAELTNQTVGWIQNGERPRFMSEGFGEFMLGSLDNAIGGFIDQYLGVGWLCEPFDLEIRQIFLEQRAVPTFEGARCSLSDILANGPFGTVTMRDYFNDFTLGGWPAFVELTKPQNNFYGSYFKAAEEQAKIAEQSREEIEQEENDGYLGQKGCVWSDAAGNSVPLTSEEEEQNRNVIGLPAIPWACQSVEQVTGYGGGEMIWVPNDPSVVRPCTPRCQIESPAAVIQEQVNNVIGGFQDRMNAMIAGATVKAGPFAIYVQAIANALINRVMQEGVGLLRAGTASDPQGNLYEPEQGEIGEYSQILGMTFNLADIENDKTMAEMAISQLELLEGTVESYRAKLQQYQGVLSSVINRLPGIQGSVQAANSGCPGDETYAARGEEWYQNARTWIAANLDGIASVGYQAAGEKAWVDMLLQANPPGMIPLIKQELDRSDSAIDLVEDYIDEAEEFYRIWKSVGGDMNNPILQQAEIDLMAVRDPAVQRTRFLIQLLMYLVNPAAADLIDPNDTTVSFERMYGELELINEELPEKEKDIDDAKGSERCRFPSPGTYCYVLDISDAVSTKSGQLMSRPVLSCRVTREDTERLIITLDDRMVVYIEPTTVNEITDTLETFEFGCDVSASSNDGSSDVNVVCQGGINMDRSGGTQIPGGFPPAGGYDPCTDLGMTRIESARNGGSDQGCDDGPGGGIYLSEFADGYFVCDAPSGVTCFIATHPPGQIYRCQPFNDGIPYSSMVATLTGQVMVPVSDLGLAPGAYRAGVYGSSMGRVGLCR